MSFIWTEVVRILVIWGRVWSLGTVSLAPCPAVSVAEKRPPHIDPGSAWTTTQRTKIEAAVTPQLIERKLLTWIQENPRRIPRNPAARPCWVTALGNYTVTECAATTNHPLLGYLTLTKTAHSRNTVPLNMHAYDKDGHLLRLLDVVSDVAKLM